MNESDKIRVMTVDDHEILRSGVRFSLRAFKDIELVAEARNGREALELCPTVNPDVVLMDMKMTGMDGIETTQKMTAQCPQIRVLALSSFYDKQLVQQAIEAGAVGFLAKGTSAKELADAIRKANAGQMSLSQEAMQQLVQPTNQTEQPPGSDLTAREQEVLLLLVDGKSNPQIAEILSISPSTAKHHVRAILSKLGASSRTEAVSIALKNNLVQ